MAQRLSGATTNSKFDLQRPEKEVTTTTNGVKTGIDTTPYGSVGLPIKQSSDGSIDVYIQDQYTEAIDLYLCKNNGTTNPSIEITKGDNTVTVV
ncbi:MAG: hypothetical protein EOL97_13760, partial [Spirochaetia bacterium]|nr:hypothetical protein [Spirochaetia bacterium]